MKYQYDTTLECMVKTLFSGVDVPYAFDGRQSTFVFGCLSTVTSYMKPPPYTPRIPPPPPAVWPQRIPRTVPSLHPRRESCRTHRSLQNSLLLLVRGRGPEDRPYPYGLECDNSVCDPGCQPRVTARRGMAAVEKNLIKKSKTCLFKGHPHV